MAQPRPGADTSIARGVLRAEHEAVLSSTRVRTHHCACPTARATGSPRARRWSASTAAASPPTCAPRAPARRPRRATPTVQSELLGMGATGRADADIAGLKQKERAAQAQTIQERMTGCSVVAPFAGRVVETMARAHEAPPANEKLIRIVSDGPLELHMVVPSKWLGWLQAGSSFDFKVDETGDVVKAKVHAHLGRGRRGEPDGEDHLHGARGAGRRCCRA